MHIAFPEKLTDEEWSEKHKQLIWVLGFENKRFNLKQGQTLRI